MMLHRGSGGYFALLALALLSAPACAQQSGEAAETALREGRYEDAIRIGTAAAAADPSDRLARTSLVGALIEVGRYDEAIEAATDLPFLRGEALRARGRLEEAEAAYEEAAREGGEYQRLAEFNLAELMYLRGERQEALARFDRFIDVYNRSAGLSAIDLVAVGDAVRYLGNDDPALFHDAVRAFDEATQQEPGYILPHIRLGELFLEKYNSQEAQVALADALEINENDPRALLGMARARAFDGDRGRAVELVQRSLEINPNLVPARLFYAETLLDVEDYDGAEEEVRRALEVNPSSLEALSTLAALLYIRDDERGYREARDRVRSLNPTYSGLLVKVAEVAAEHRRYADAAELAAEAVRLDPSAWDAYGVLGLNLFRLGRVAEARESLERSFAGDPYNVWIKNNLDLLDTFTQYETLTFDGFELMLHENEADLLMPYLRQAATEAYTVLSARYGDQPRGPIRLEFYPRSADFSVRTVGLAGLGALGVSFGDVLALDSPAAREAGSYNWLTTLWHELTHTVTLGVSNSRVPRWLTEGLAVYEERRARPSWGTHIMPELLLAYDEGELPPVSRLNEGFIRPPSPQHLAHAYDMASLVVEWIEETRGFDAILGMLHAYGDGRSTDQIFRSVLGAEPEAVDEAFDQWLRERWPPQRAREFRDLMTEARRSLEREQLAEARTALEAAAELFPVSRVGSPSPYALLAQLHVRQGDEDAAIEALRQLTTYDETAYQGNLELARLLEERGDTNGAIEALDRAVWIFPYEVAPHVKLAELAAASGDHERAVRERRAIIGLRPTDLADAYYRLALALFEAGQAEDARSELLRALEIAPGFQQAQELLLRLHEGT